MTYRIIAPQEQELSFILSPIFNNSVVYSGQLVTICLTELIYENSRIGFELNEIKE